MPEASTSDIVLSPWLCHFDSLLRVITLLYLGRPAETVSAVQSHLANGPGFNTIWNHIKEKMNADKVGSADRLDAALTILSAYLIAPGPLMTASMDDPAVGHLRMRARNLLHDEL